MGYIHVGPEHLRKYQELASRYILNKIGLEWTPGTWPPRLASSPETVAPADRSAQQHVGMNCD